VGLSVASITLTNPGSGYTAAPAVTFTGGAGTAAAASTTIGAVSEALIFPDTLGYIDQARLQRAQFLGIEKAEWDLNNAINGYIDLVWSDTGEVGLRMIGRAARDFSCGMGGLNPPGPHAPGSTGGINILTSGMANGYWFILYLDKRLPNP
jgi:hypothetical protein